MARDGGTGSNDRQIQADAALVARVGAGDSAACRRIVDAHLGRVAGFAWRMLGDGAEAEDVAQEAFLRLWRTAPRWRPEARIGTWLHRVAHNLCVDRLRRRGPAADTEVGEIADPSVGPGAHRHRADIARAVDVALAALPERQRAAIVLVHYQDLGNIEAACAMEISVEALESLLSRGRRALRESLRDRRDDLMGEM